VTSCGAALAGFWLDLVVVRNLADLLVVGFLSDRRPSETHRSAFTGELTSSWDLETPFLMGLGVVEFVSMMVGIDRFPGDLLAVKLPIEIM